MVTDKEIIADPKRNKKATKSIKSIRKNVKEIKEDLKEFPTDRTKTEKKNIKSIRKNIGGIKKDLNKFPTEKTNRYMKDWKRINEVIHRRFGKRIIDKKTYNLSFARHFEKRLKDLTPKQKNPFMSGAYNNYKKQFGIKDSKQKTLR